VTARAQHEDTRACKYTYLCRHTRTAEQSTEQHNTAQHVLYTRAHTYTDTRARKHARTHARTRVRTLARSHARMHTRTHARDCTHARTRKHSHARRANGARRAHHRALPIERSHLSAADLARVTRLERLDELEEWVLIQRHYCLVPRAGAQGRRDAERPSAWRPRRAGAVPVPARAAASSPPYLARAACTS
jgi:hypothetical protein